MLGSAEQSLHGWEGYGLAALLACDVRALGLEVKADPLDDNPAHAVVQGNKTKAIAWRLARTAKWIVQVGKPDETAAS